MAWRQARGAKGMETRWLGEPRRRGAEVGLSRDRCRATSEPRPAAAPPAAGSCHRIRARARTQCAAGAPHVYELGGVAADHVQVQGEQGGVGCAARRQQHRVGHPQLHQARVKGAGGLLRQRLDALKAPGGGAAHAPARGGRGQFASWTECSRRPAGRGRLAVTWAAAAHSVCYHAEGWQQAGDGDAPSQRVGGRLHALGCSVGRLRCRLLFQGNQEARLGEIAVAGCILERQCSPISHCRGAGWKVIRCGVAHPVLLLAEAPPAVLPLR
jgi:hypothetical protein